MKSLFGLLLLCVKEEEIKMKYIGFWFFRSVFVLSAMLVLSLGYVQAQITDFIPVFVDELGNLDRSIIFQNDLGTIHISGANNMLALGDIGCGAGIGSLAPMSCQTYQFLGQSFGATFINSFGAGGISFRHNNEEANQMTILPNGNVGIATNNPQFRLELPNLADTRGRGRANAWFTYSSRRWKENITPIDHALDKVARLRGVFYDGKEDKKHSIGIIAEEAGQVLPELVDYEANGKDARGLDYARLSAVLIEAVKELKTENQALQRRIEGLESHYTSAGN